MNILGKNKVRSFLTNTPSIKETTNFKIRKNRGHFVKSFAELAEKVAALSFAHPEHVLFFRGQSHDLTTPTQGLTSLKPKIFRPERGSRTSPAMNELLRRYEMLDNAEQSLARSYNLTGEENVKRYRILRWSILQHYEVCATPLLDVTQSLRIAASFASNGETNEKFVFVLAIPQLSGGVTASSADGILTIRLSSVCPPEALRPHFQEGYLVGTYPELQSTDEKALYEAREIDFGRRLLCKFRFKPGQFWHDDAFPQVPDAALYPNDNDPLWRLTQPIKQQLERQFM